MLRRLAQIESYDNVNLEADDEVILLGCSNGLSLSEEVRTEITTLYDCLVNEFNLKVHISPTVYVDPLTNQTHDPTYRKDELFAALTDYNIKAIIDLSGGDLANEVLTQFTDLEWDAVQSIENKFYIGYSDNSVIINALLQKTSVKVVNFLVTNIVKDHTGTAKDGFKRVLFNNERLDRQRTVPESVDVSTTVFGGNIRCFLKLAGTAYWEFDTIPGLLLEAQSGNINRIRSYFAQLDLLNVFTQIDFVVFGQFTEINNNDEQDELNKLIQSYQNKYNFKVYYTEYVGHHEGVYPFVMN